MVGSELEVYTAPGEPGPLHEPCIKNQTRTSKQVDKQTNKQTRSRVLRQRVEHFTCFKLRRTR